MSDCRSVGISVDDRCSLVTIFDQLILRKGYLLTAQWWGSRRIVFRQSESCGVCLFDTHK